MHAICLNASVCRQITCRSYQSEHSVSVGPGKDLRLHVEHTHKYAVAVQARLCGRVVSASVAASIQENHVLHRRFGQM